MIQGSSHARTARSAAGHERRGRGGGMRSIFPPPRRVLGDRVSLSGVVAALGGAAVVIPVEREGTADQHPVAPDGTITPHLVVAPAQRSSGLLVALLYPVP